MESAQPPLVSYEDREGAIKSFWARLINMNFKIRTAPVAQRSLEFTSQLYFDDGLTDRVHADPPYAAKGPRTARNRHDWIFRRGGDQLMLAPTTVADGYAAAFAIGLQLP